LLNDLLKNTPEDHPDRAIVEGSLNEIVEVANYVNQKKKESENLSAVCIIASRMTGYPVETEGRLVQPYRSLMHHGAINEFEIKENVKDSNNLDNLSETAQWHERYLFVFNDMIITTKKGTTGLFSSFHAIETKDTVNLESLEPNSQFKYFHHYNLANLEIEDFPDDEHRLDFGIKEWQSQNFRFVYHPYNSKQKEEWIQIIDDTISTQIKTVSNRYSNNEELFQDDVIGDEYKKGILKKRGKDQEWKEKYFVLTENYLMICNSKEDYESETDVRKYHIITTSISRWPVSDVEHCMELRTKKKIMPYCRFFWI